MEYKLCKDNVICCDDDCRRCANRAYEALTNENNSLKQTNKECLDKIEELQKTIDYLHEENIKLRNRNRCIDNKLDELVKENSQLKEECEKLHSDNQRLAHECRYYIERESNLVMENDKLRSENQMLEFQKKQLKEEFDTLTIESYKAVRNLEHDKALLQNECNRLSIDNKNLVHWNLRLTKERENVLISEEDDTNQCDVCSELSDKIEGLKEDIIRLDKCLSKRPCVKEERYGE